jgi:phosphate uptake regulator
MRQPVAIDLRHIIAGLKMAAEMERIADNASAIWLRPLLWLQMNSTFFLSI